ncbi:MAG: hypothetical protein M3336_17515 [Chloroflexota bacterium]|nr:hypothetical protein [Chloroflexota bacterium]
MRNPLTTRMWRTSDHLDVPPELRLDPMPAAPGLALVDPELTSAGAHHKP